MSTKIFVNLPVNDLARSMEFFKNLGYRFNRQFTDEKAACLMISEDIYAMLLLKRFFKDFTKKKIANSAKSTESIVSLSAESKGKVDELVEKALQAGAKPNGEPNDHDWMYTRGFEDLDGHLWEIIWMDERKVEKN